VRPLDRSAKTTIAVGVLTAALGLLPILTALGVIPAGHMSAEDSAPAWVGIACGLIFVFGGAAAVMQALINGDGSSDSGISPDAPRWIQAIYMLVGLGIVVGLGAVMSWIAFGAGERHCSGSATFFGAFSTGDAVCRGVFGFAAMLTWITLLAMIVFYAKRLMPRPRA
jgi:hypothetical protein